MKMGLFIAAAALVAWLGYHLASPEDGAHAIGLTERRAPPTATVTDPAEVFQRAFWKRPTPNDKILHAERREWSDAAGVKKWQWFIAVEPSPELTRHLRTDNAFNLAPATTAGNLPDSPDWFVLKSDAMDILQSPGGNLRLCFSKTGNTLYATDAGGGFRPGAPEVPKPAPAPAVAGRIPLTRPPNPSNP